MIYGYARCSTNETKQNIDRQVRDIKNLVNEKVDFIFAEYESGTKTNREELRKLLSMVNNGDTIVCTEVSRISRSTKHLCEIIELAKNKKLKLIFGSFVVDCTNELDAMTEGMLKIIGVFAEIERNIISQRVKSGLANAKAKGIKPGRKAVTIDDIPPIFFKYYAMYKNNNLNKTEFSRLTGLTRPTIYKYIKLIDEFSNKEDI